MGGGDFGPTPTQNSQNGMVKAATILFGFYML